ncbi:MAG: uroporphyrinogen-III C-methyltransferase [Actinomycetota bacterium]|nr:uroporphyrinogen-III C-methyltransferase [Actinomycetota bacterium]
MSVALVGAGPGDPGLLTRRAAVLLAAADVVVYDRLVDERVLELAPADAERIDVGKRRGGDAGAAQLAINELLVERGRAGKAVVRLKGGDPYIFGRGAEEALALAEAGVDYEVVPGISAALGVPALAGIPLTLRSVASSFAVVTGHEPANNAAGWAGIVASGATIVVLMGAESRAAVAEALIAAGMAPSTPVAAVMRGATATQRTVRTSLAGLGASEIESPATLVVGAVAALALASLEDRPLSGRRVVVTRASEQAASLVEALSGLGAQVLECPTIAVAPPSDGGAALDAALGRLTAFAWIAFTSQNAVFATMKRVRDARALAGPKIAAVGPRTAEALARAGIVADLVAELARGEELARQFPPPAGAGGVLLPAAAEASPALEARLAAAGWRVERVTAYQTVPAALSPERLAAVRGADAITFASGSAVRHFLERAGSDAFPPVVASIGPVTSEAVRACGVHVDVEAERADAASLASALAAHFAALRCEHA